MKTGTKLAIVGLLLVGVTAYLAYLGAASSWQYYVTVDECLTDAARLRHDRVRVNGKIAAGTLQVSADRRQARFALEAAAGQLWASCPGPLPDNLAEGRDVVVEGRLSDGGELCGEKVLTRCASKYKSQEAAQTASMGGSQRTEQRR